LSAYVVERIHVAAIIGYAIDRGYGPFRLFFELKDSDAAWDAACGFADMLMRQNVRSVATRYGYPMHDPEPYTKRELVEARVKALIKSTVAFYKACRCLIYQSCETEDYERTAAGVMVRRLLDDAMAAYFMSLPAYADAPWSLTEDTDDAPPVPKKPRRKRKGEA